MNSNPARRVVVAVEPRLLGDALTVALRNTQEGVEIVTAPSSGGAGSGRYDLAVVSSSGSLRVRADTVVFLPDNAGSEGVGIVVAGGREEDVPLRDLDDVIGVVHRLLADTQG